MTEGNISANDQAILELLENDARLDARDLADILGEEAQEVQQAVRRMEEQKIICGYHTVINYNKVLRDERIMAFIEVDVSPMKDKGYDHTAALLAKYPEIDSLYLITGDNDFICLKARQDDVRGVSIRGRSHCRHGERAKHENVVRAQAVQTIRRTHGRRSAEPCRGPSGGELLMKPINQTIAHLKPSGIRKYFDLADSMEGVISLGVGSRTSTHRGISVRKQWSPLKTAIRTTPRTGDSSPCASKSQGITTAATASTTTRNPRFS